ELELTFNLGVGMVAVVPAARAADALALLSARGVPAWEMGRLQASGADDPSAPTTELVANYAGIASTWC
ncbi:MAG: AIR synthase-related protein, partial [Jatrophihabitans sp.]|uniref:AIR synthase-related protein n=1 Tax=Jatrophihabitans sp. TaxID=1932789 RepID=UPI003914E91F